MSTAEDIRPTIIVDTREQNPLVFTHLPSRPGTLYTGDYSIAGLTERFAVERKSIPDLVGSVIQGRERFEHELHRLRGFWFRRLVIVGSRTDIEQHRYESKALPQAVLASVAAFEVRYDIPTLWIPDAADAAVQVERWAVFFSREVLKHADAMRKSLRE